MLLSWRWKHSVPLKCLYLNIVIFWDIAPCSLHVNQTLGGTYHFHFSVQYQLSKKPVCRTYGLHGAISQRRAAFITTTVETSNPICFYLSTNYTVSLGRGLLILVWMMLYIYMWIVCSPWFLGGHSTFFGFINTFVHIVMYTYYLLAALGPHYQKYLWWKKYLTTFQMVSK
jgi:hypothetical protein